MKTLIYLVRHGESIGNMLRKCLGHTDLGLTDVGRAQAEATAERLSEVKFDAIYSSDLIRAMETAAPHASLRGMEVIPREDLREMYFGAWENMYLSDIIERYGDLYTVTWREHFGTFTSPDGESVPELASRVYNAVLDIARSAPGETLLIASHAAAIRAFWGVISGIPDENLSSSLPFPSNASYSVLEYDSETELMKPLRYSIDDHLTSIYTAWKD